MRIDVLTLFPEVLQAVLEASILRRAREAGLVEVDLINFRDFTHDRHRTVDDTPYGGGQGMLIKPDPVFEAMDRVRERARERGTNPYVVLTSPQGVTLTQARAKDLAAREHLVIICGHYEGFDDRIREGLVDESLSIGDYVLTGGELPALVLIDTVTRLIPGVLAANSALDESFYDGLLEYPQFTRPPEYRGMKVPEVLLSGDHGRIAKWRREQSLLRTLRDRPDLLETAELTAADRKFLARVRSEVEGPDGANGSKLL